MKFKLSVSLLRKIIIGTTIFNGFLLITYIFHIITLTVNETYMLFILSIPAFLLSKSWLLLIGLFGFEGLLLTYYWLKTRTKAVGTVSTAHQETASSNPELLDFDEILEVDAGSEERFAVEPPQHNDQPTEEESDVESQEPQEEPFIETSLQHNTFVTSSEEEREAELEFDKLWEEAIQHVRKAAIKKKAGPTLTPKQQGDQLQPATEPAQSKTSKRRRNNDNSIKGSTATPKEQLHSSLAENPLSRAVIRKSKLKPKKHRFNPSIIREEHREFYNEIALNNWIYQDSQVRKDVGLYKTALDETHFQEVDIQYLIEAGVLYKLLIPFPTGAFVVYSINESEDKKIIRNYLAKLCKKNNIRLQQKNVSFVNYTELGLERKTWRFDIAINRQVLGVIWLSNFIISDDFGTNYALTFQHKKELKALFAATQVFSAKGENLTPVIITDYSCNKAIIQKHIKQQGFGPATILTVGEKSFLEEFFALLRKGTNPIVSPKN